MRGGTKKRNRAAQEVPAGRLILLAERLVVMFGRERGAGRLVGRHGVINGFLGAKESSNAREKWSRSFLIVYGASRHK
ncbi:hypothetical protein Tco_1061802 [Tanacetum coccineum]